MGKDPHAGLGVGDAPAGHGDLGVATVDPTQVLEGTITIDPKLTGGVKAGDAVFLVVRSGSATGPILAVDRLDASAGQPMPFRLSGANAMMAGSKFEGDVWIIARVDKDGEARSRSPGDIEGRLQAKIPAKGLLLKLDTPVQ